MTIIQMEYIVAVDTFRHFAGAAEKCFVTQPTLSMQIQKLEKELGVMLFDRSTQPVQTTDIGEIIIRQAREVLNEFHKIKETVKHYENDLSGHLNIGIIPTVAPYLLPMFLKSFIDRYPKINLRVEELLTMDIVKSLKSGLLDIGIVSTPLEENGLKEIPIFYDPFLIYLSGSHPLLEKKSLSMSDIDISDVWLLTEGHCFRNQIENLCETKRQKEKLSKFQYKTGSLETIIKLMKKQGGLTILPTLAALEMKNGEKQLLREFNGQKPKREISIIFKNGFYKLRLIESLKKEILDNLPEDLKIKRKEKVVKWK